MHIGVSTFRPGGFPNDKQPKHIVFANRLLKKIVRNELKNPMNKSSQTVKELLKTLANKDARVSAKANFVRLLEKHKLLTKPYSKYLSCANGSTLRAHFESIKKGSRR
jgi:hypothetical protein